MCSDPLDSGGEVRGCPVGCALGMPAVLPFRAAAALDVHTVFPELQNCIFKRVWLRAVVVRHFGQVRGSGARKIVFIWCSDWPKIVLFFTPFHVPGNFCNLLHAPQFTAAKSSSRRHFGRSSTHVESSDTMRSRKAQ